MTTLVAALDCGTSTMKAGLIDLSGKLCGYAKAPVPMILSVQGQVEICPFLLKKLAFDTLREAVQKSGCRAVDVAGICVTGQRASFLTLDKACQPVGNVISWQDSRGAGEINLLRERLDSEGFRVLTGLPLNPVFTLGKLMWLLKNDPARAAQTSMVATVPDFLLRELGDSELVTDYANASLTGMFDINRRVWSEPVLQAADISFSLLPKLVAPGSRVGLLCSGAAEEVGLLSGTPLIAGAGDHQCAGIGAGAFEPGIVELALGTAGVPLLAIEHLPAELEAGLMYCCHAVPDWWEVEGFQNSAGAALAWGERVFGKAASQSPGGGVCRPLPGSHGLLFLPYLCGGSSAPYWNPAATGVFLGLSLSNSSADMAMAVLEGFLLDTAQVLDVFDRAGMLVSELRLTGGCSCNPHVPALLAGITGLPVRLPEHHEAGLVGASLLAATGVGAFSSLRDAARAMVRLGPALDVADDYREACLLMRGKFQRVAAAFESSRLFTSGEVVGNA